MSAVLSMLLSSLSQVSHGAEASCIHGDVEACEDSWQAQAEAFVDASDTAVGVTPQSLGALGFQLQGLKTGMTRPHCPAPACEQLGSQQWRPWRGASVAVVRRAPDGRRVLLTSTKTSLRWAFDDGDFVVREVPSVCGAPELVGQHVWGVAGANCDEVGVFTLAGEEVAHLHTQAGVRHLTPGEAHVVLTLRGDRPFHEVRSETGPLEWGVPGTRSDTPPEVSADGRLLFVDGQVFVPGEPEPYDPRAIGSLSLHRVEEVPDAPGPTFEPERPTRTIRVVGPPGTHVWAVEPRPWTDLSDEAQRFVRWSRAPRAAARVTLDAVGEGVLELPSDVVWSLFFGGDGHFEEVGPLVVEDVARTVAAPWSDRAWADRMPPLDVEAVLAQVLEDGEPVPGALVLARNRLFETDADGRAWLPRGALTAVHGRRRSATERPVAQVLTLKLDTPMESCRVVGPDGAPLGGVQPCNQVSLDVGHAEWRVVAVTVEDGVGRLQLPSRLRMTGDEVLGTLWSGERKVGVLGSSWTGLDAGRYVLAVPGPDGWSRQRVAFDGGRQDVTVDLEPWPGREVFVRDASGAPVELALLGYDGPVRREGGRVWTDGDGRATVPLHLDGDARIRAPDDGAGTREDPIVGSTGAGPDGEVVPWDSADLAGFWTGSTMSAKVSIAEDAVRDTSAHAGLVEVQHLARTDWRTVYRLADGRIHVVGVGTLTRR